MRTLYNILVSALLFASCDVHEWPEMPENVRLYLQLEYETEMTLWELTYDEGRLTDHGTGGVYDVRMDSGKIRHIVRAYPLSEGQLSVDDYPSDFIFVRDLSEGYDCTLEIALPAGSYKVMVWSDLLPDVEDEYFYDAADFSQITLHGAYRGNTDYRDAFRGYGEVSLASSLMETAPDTLEVVMCRPLAKYGFVTTDQRFNSVDCSVRFLYSGFLPCSYDMFSDRPNDAVSGMSFDSAPDLLGPDMASLGFDYVFVNGKQSAVDVDLVIYGADGKQVARTGTIQVPLMRNRHTVIKGPFLMMQASGGINIDPVFDGNYNIVID